MAIGFPVVVGEATHSVMIGSRPIESSKGGIWFNGLPAEGRFPSAYQATFNRFRSGISLELVIHAPEVVAVREGNKLIQGRSAITALLLASHFDCSPLARVLVSGSCNPDTPGHFEHMPIIALGGPDESGAKIKSRILGFGYSLFIHEDDLAGLTSDDLAGQRVLSPDEWQSESPQSQLVRIPKGMLLGELAKVLKVRSFDEIEREQRAALRHPAVVPVGEGRVDRAVARIINERTQRFFGRESEQAALDAWLQSSDRGIKLVLAPAGLGKSALLANWISRRREQDDHILQHFFAHRLPETVEAISAMDYLWRQHQKMSGQTQPSAPLDRERLGSALAAELGRDQSKRLILVLDGLDEAGEDFPNFLPAGGVGANVHVVLGVRDDGTERIPKVALRWLAEQDEEARREPVYLKPLDLAAIRAWLLAERPDLAASYLDPWLRQLMNASDGVPLFLHFLLDDVRTTNLRPGRLPILPGRFRDYLQGELDWMRQGDRGCWIKLLALLTRTFGPIAQTELAKLKDEDGLSPFRELSVQVAESRILRWLSLTGEERNPSYSFVHPRFAQAFAEVLPVDLIERIEHWLVAHANRWREVGMDYALQSGLQHLIEAGKPESALTLMRDIDFHCARIERFRDADILATALRLVQGLQKSPNDQRWVSGLAGCASLISPLDRKERASVLRDFARDFLGVPDKQGRRIRLSKPEAWEQSALVAVLQGHRGFVRGAALIPGNRILSWGTDSTVRLWNASDGALVTVLEGHAHTIDGALGVSADRLVTWSDDGNLRLWDPADGAPIAVLEGHKQGVNGALVVSTERLVSWSADCTLRLWRAADGSPVAVLKGHTSNVVGALVVSAERLLSWGDDSTLRLWNAENGALVAVLDGHNGKIKGAMAVSKARLASWSEDGTLSLWNAVDGAPIAVLEGHNHRINGALVVSEERLLSWSWGGTLRLWNAADGAPVAVFEGDSYIQGALVVSEERLLTWRKGGTPRLWNAADLAPIASLDGHDLSIEGALVVSKERLLTWSWDRILRLWSAADGALIAVLDGHRDLVVGALTISAERLLSWSWDTTLRLWDVASVAPVAERQGHTGTVRGAIVVSPERLLSWSTDRTLRLWNTVSGASIAVLEGHKSPIDGALVVSEERLLSWSYKTLRLWKTADGAPVAILEGHEGVVSGALVVSAERLLSWGCDDTLRLWNAADGAPVAMLKGHWGAVNGALVVSAERLLSWSDDGTLRLWHVANCEPIAARKGHEDGIDGALVVSAERLVTWCESVHVASPFADDDWIGDNTLRLWNAVDGAPVAELRGHTDWINGALVISEERLLSWSRDGTLRLWNTVNGAIIAVLAEHQGSVNGTLVVSAERLLSWSGDGTLRLWDSGDGAPIATLQGHSAPVMGAMEIYANRLLSWSKDGTLRLWDRSGTPIAVWAQPYGSISTVVAVSRQRVAVLVGSHVMFVDITDDLTHA